MWFYVQDSCLSIILVILACTKNLLYSRFHIKTKQCLLQTNSSLAAVTAGNKWSEHNWCESPYNATEPMISAQNIAERMSGF